MVKSRKIPFDRRARVQTPFGSLSFPALSEGERERRAAKEGKDIFPLVSFQPLLKAGVHGLEARVVRLTKGIL